LAKDALRVQTVGDVYELNSSLGGLFALCGRWSN
jgi:cob(I)alamin adenosyltransferase